MVIDFLKFSKIYFIFSGILILLSLTFLFAFGLKLGIEFTGGSILELEYKNARPSNQEIKKKIEEFDLGEVYLQPAGERGLILRMKSLDETSHQKILQRLKENQEVKEQRFETIGPVIGQELKQKTKIVVILALSAMVFYIALAFRRVSRPVKSWQYSLVSLFLLSHDVLIPLGIFSVLGKFSGVQITIPVIVGLLTIIGYAINNVVVVFDRIRENLLKKIGISFEETANFALNQTLTRQINTSLTTLFPLIFIFFIGGETLKYFALVLIIGISSGAYSSVFLAGPLLVSWLNWKEKKKLR